MRKHIPGITIRTVEQEKQRGYPAAPEPEIQNLQTFRVLEKQIHKQIFISSTLTNRNSRLVRGDYEESDES